MKIQLRIILNITNKLKDQNEQIKDIRTKNDFNIKKIIFSLIQLS